MSLDVNISEPEEFNCCELHNSIKKIAVMKGINDFEYHVDTISGKGDNYIANLFRVKIRDPDDATNTVSVIVKTLVNSARQETFHELHKREVAVYEKVIPKLIEIQRSLNDEDKVLFPNCLLSNSEDGKEILVLEDMREKGYSMTDKVVRFEPLDINEVQLIIIELAKFHALSFIYQKRDPEVFASLKHEFIDLIFDKRFLNKSKLRKYYMESFEMSLKVVDVIKARRSLDLIASKLMESLRFYTEPKKYSVLCHGDCWINNVLFKNSDLGDRLCFLDFQAMRYANPVTDIIHFIYLCTNSNFRFQHFDALLDLYYESLGTFLKLFNENVNLIYPRDDFDIDVKNMLPFGLLIALVELRIVTCTPEDIDTMKGSRPALNILESPNGSELFKMRVNDVVQEAIRHDTISKLIDNINSSLQC